MKCSKNVGSIHSPPDNKFVEELERRIARWNEIITADIPIPDVEWGFLEAIETEFLEARYSGNWDTFVKYLDKHEAKLREIRCEFLKTQNANRGGLTPETKRKLS